MFMLLSPAKTLDFEKPVSMDKYTLPFFENEAQKIIEELKNLSKSDISRLMGVSARIAELNYNRFKNFSSQPENALARQALLAYKGDVYREIDSNNYSEKDFDFAQRHLIIISGLYGVLKPLDLIQPYRLEMDINLKIDKFSNIYEFWGGKITDRINTELKEFGYSHVINLASNEYFNSVKTEKLKGTLIKVTFFELRDDRYKIIGILSKKARGMMTNYIIKNKIEKPEEIKSFNIAGYEFNPEFSSEEEYVFTR